MPIEFACTQCRKKLRVPDEKAGKKVKCPGCQSVMTVPTAQLSAVDASAQGRSVEMTGVPAPRTGISGTDLAADKPVPSTGRSSVMMTGVDQPAMQASLVAPSPLKDKKPKEAPGKAEPEPAPVPVAGDDLQGDDLQLELEPTDEPVKPMPPAAASKKADEILDEYGLVGDDDEGGIQGPASGKNAVRTGGGAAAAAAAARKLEDAKKAMTVLDGEEEFGGFDLDAAGAGAAAAGKKDKPKSKTAEEEFEKGATLQTVGSTEPAPDDARTQGEQDKGKAPEGFAAVLKNLPPAALYGGIAGVVGLVAAVVYFAFFFGGDKPGPVRRPSPPARIDDTGVVGGPKDDTKLPDDPESKTPDPAAKAKVDVVALLTPSPEEEQTTAIAREFWTKYDAAVVAGSAREWKALAEWCGRNGLAGARLEALEHARMHDPEDPDVRRQLGQTVPLQLPPGRTVYTTPQARALVDRMTARVVVGNRAHPELRVRISGGPAEFVLKRGESRSVERLKPGPTEIVFTAGGKSATVNPSLLPGEAYGIDFLPPEALPSVPYSAYKACETAVRLREAGGLKNLSGAVPRGLGPYRVLEISHDAKKNEYTIRTAGDFPAEFFDPVRRRPAERKASQSHFRPAKDDAPARFETGEGAVRTVMQLQRVDPRGVLSGRILDRGAALFSTDVGQTGGYAPADAASATMPPLTFSPADRMLSGAVEVEVFPVPHSALWTAAGLDPAEVTAAVERRKFPTLPREDAPPAAADLLTRVRFTPSPTWSWDEFAGYCRYRGVSPQLGAAYHLTPLGTYGVVRRMDVPLLEMLRQLPDATVIASLARFSKDAEGALAAQAANPRSWQRPYAVMLLSWPGNNAAVELVKALAADYIRFEVTGGGAVDAMVRSLFVSWSEDLSIPDLIAACLVNIATDKSIDELRRMAEDPRSGTKLASACVPALSRSGHERAVPFMIDLLRRNPTFRSLQAQWVGRWDLPETRRLVDARLKKGAEAEGLQYLALALEQQERGRGNFYILKKLSEYKPEETELVRVATGQKWNWVTQTLQKGALPKRMVPAVCWLLGRRGDIPAAGLLRGYFQENLPAVLESMIKSGEARMDAAEFLYPMLRAGENHSELRYSRFGGAPTLYEEAFGAFTGRDAAPLISVAGAAALDPRVSELGWRSFYVKMLAGFRNPAAAPLLHVFLKQQLTEGMTGQGLAGAATAAWLGLTALGDKESLAALASQKGRDLYERIGYVTKSFVVQWGGGAGTDVKDDQLKRQTAQLVAALQDNETGLPTKLAADWNAFVDRTAWAAFRGLFLSVRDPDAGTAEPDYLGYHRVVARLEREEEEHRARKTGVKLDPPVAVDPFRSESTRLRPGLDEEQIESIVRILTNLVWPDDDFRESAVPAEFARLRQQALTALIDLERPKDLLDRLRKSAEFPSLGAPVIRRLAQSKEAADLDRIIERTTKEISVSPQRGEARASRRLAAYNGTGLQRLNSLLQEAATRNLRVDTATAVPLLAFEAYDVHEVFKGDLTVEAIRALGRINNQKCLDHLIGLVDGKSVPANNYQTGESCEREILRRAAALSALADADPVTARDKLIHYLRTKDPDSFGFKALVKVDDRGRNTPEALERQRLILVARLRRAFMSATARILNDECVPALAAVLETRTTEPIGSAAEMTPVHEAERETARDALRLLLWKGAKAAGPVLIRQLDPAQSERLGFNPRSPTARVLLPVVGERCMSRETAPLLYTLLSDTRAEKEFRRWALDNLITTGDEKQLEALVAFIGGPEFRKTFETPGQSDALLTIFQQVRDPASGMSRSAATAFYLRLLSTVGGASDGIVTAAAAREALLALASFDHPDAKAALQKLRDVPRYRYAAAYLLFGKGDLESIDLLAAPAADAKKDEADKALECLSAMPHPKTLGALLDFVEKSTDREVRIRAAGALYRMTMDLTAGREGEHSVPLEITDRIVKQLPRAPAEIAYAFTLVLAAAGHDAGLEPLAREAVQAPSAGPDNERMLTVIDVLASRSGYKLTPGIRGLLEAILIKRRIGRPIGEPLTTSAAELAARTKFFEDKLAMDEVLKKIGTRVAVLEALLLLDNGRLGQEARLMLESIRDRRGPATMPKASQKETEEEAAEATAALTRAGRN